MRSRYSQMRSMTLARCAPVRSGPMLILSEMSCTLVGFAGSLMHWLAQFTGRWVPPLSWWVAIFILRSCVLLMCAIGCGYSVLILCAHSLVCRRHVHSASCCRRPLHLFSPVRPLASACPAAGSVVQPWPLLLPLCCCPRWLGHVGCQSQPSPSSPASSHSFAAVPACLALPWSVGGMWVCGHRLSLWLRVLVSLSGHPLSLGGHLWCPHVALSCCHLASSLGARLAVWSVMGCRAKVRPSFPWSHVALLLAACTLSMSLFLSLPPSLRPCQPLSLACLPSLGPQLSLALCQLAPLGGLWACW